jgi:hypothetical protein
VYVVFAGWLCLATGLVAYAQSDGSQPPDAAAVDSQPSDSESVDAAPPDESGVPAGPALQSADVSPVICNSGSSGFRYLEVRGTGFDAWASQRLVGNLVDGNGVPHIQWGSVWVSPQGRLTLEVNLCADPFRGRGALPAGDYTVAVGPGDGRSIATTSIALTPPPDVPTEGEALATPTPRSGPGTRAQPVPLGVPGMLVDGWQLAVTGVTADAWSGIHAAVPSSVAPASDQKDFMVQVQATYPGQGTGVFSAMRVALVIGSGTSYDQLHNGCGVVPEMVPANLVTSGGVVRGNVCFTVRTSDIDSLVLVDSQSVDKDRVYFALK